MAKYHSVATGKYAVYTKLRNAIHIYILWSKIVRFTWQQPIFLNIVVYFSERKKKSIFTKPVYNDPNS